MTSQAFRGTPNLRTYKLLHVGGEPDYRVAFVETPEEGSPLRGAELFRTRHHRDARGARKRALRGVRQGSFCSCRLTPGADLAHTAGGCAMIPFDFVYYRAEVLKEAADTHAWLRSEGKNPIYYAGGSEIITLCRADRHQAGRGDRHQEYPGVLWRCRRTAGEHTSGPRAP